MVTALHSNPAGDRAVRGEFVDLGNERFYAIHNVDAMAPFFVNVVSNVDHWLFASSSGGLTAGRVSPDTALFPYVTVDKIHQSAHETGPKTVLHVSANGQQQTWEPFNREHNHRYSVTRNLYKNLLGNKLCFEEINHDLSITFRYTWASSETFGFTRQCELHNTGSQRLRIDLLDGLQNILPAGTPRFAQTNTSNLVDAYKWSELDEANGLALYTLYSGVTDRAEPSESLRANTVFCLGLEASATLISSDQLERFRQGLTPSTENQKRGIRGAYFVNSQIELGAGQSVDWQIVADLERDQSDVVALQRQLRDRPETTAQLAASIQAGSESLARIMASSDANQATAEEHVSVHHYANVLFNVLRGGYFFDQYQVPTRDFVRTVRHFNVDVYHRTRQFLDALPAQLRIDELRDRVASHGDPQLLRLCSEYLPITFGRRHGDPSRPWNLFSIDLRDHRGDPLLSYEGNWRDIFQNWEALAFSYPEFVDSMIAKFVNASTADGYNPYRITKQGIDWEVEEPDNPWSYIGYWGDHQIIYLQKLLELSKQFHPERLGQLLHDPLFAYANVPYRIRPFDQLVKNPKATVDFDEQAAALIDERVARLGADGKLILDADGGVYHVTLLEKLLVALLAKLGNFVVDSGIWLNTQRPEWNDANNALVGQGLSMVTLYYLRRYVSFFADLLADEQSDIELSTEVARWLEDSAEALRALQAELNTDTVPSAQQMTTLRALGEAAGRHRESVYSAGTFSGKTTVSIDQILELLTDARTAIDHSIAANQRQDGLFQAYNTVHFGAHNMTVEPLGPMLEGQVAALSAGALDPAKAADVVEALFDSDVYRADQQSFMLYPDRSLPSFLEKNRIPAAEIERIDLLRQMLDDGDDRLVTVDIDGQHRFNADFANKGVLDACLDDLVEDYDDAVDAARDDLHALYERVFDHQAFTGRSGTMFGFEGLGCIYWHMVAKLLLAVQENFFASASDDASKARLADLYYRVRRGLGFNKSPAEYGAFPTDPYSHTPGQSGAKQPGMTGQVKEEILTRFGELGLRVNNAAVSFEPDLLRQREFSSSEQSFCYLDVDNAWQDMVIPPRSLAFTWCQVPIQYTLSDDAPPAIQLSYADGRQATIEGLTLPPEESTHLYQRDGQLRHIAVTFSSQRLFNESQH